MQSMEGFQIATLSPTAAKGRFGVAYFRSVCGQAGVGFNETSADEDALAVDGTIEFSEGGARVQIKCTGQFRISGGSTATWQAEPEWRAKWKASLVPVYFVIVMLDPDKQETWLDHQETGTFQSAAAFWVRVNHLSETGGVTVPKSQRLSVDTFTLWRNDFLEGYSGTEPGRST
jgi:Domain of unknown function (DUF4365)